jgi:hypothetical protein
VLRKIFGSKRDKITGNGVDYIKRNFMISSSLNTTRVIKKCELGGACSTVGGKEKIIQCFDLKAEGKRPLGR